MVLILHALQWAADVDVYVNVDVDADVTEWSTLLCYGLISEKEKVFWNREDMPVDSALYFKS